MCFGAGGICSRQGGLLAVTTSPPEGQEPCLVGHSRPPQAPDAVQTQELSSDSRPCWIWPVPVLFLPALPGSRAPSPPSPWQQPAPSRPAAWAHRDHSGAPLQMSQHCRAPTLPGHPAPPPAPAFGTSVHSRDEPQERKGLPHSAPLSSEPWGASAVQVGRSCLCHVPGTAQPCDSGVWEM